jgi:uncharacterized membrane protein YqjE
MGNKRESLKNLFVKLTIRFGLITVLLTLMYIWIDTYKLAHKIGGTALLTGLITIVCAICVAVNSEHYW